MKNLCRFVQVGTGLVPIRHVLSGPTLEGPGQALRRRGSAEPGSWRGWLAGGEGNAALFQRYFPHCTLRASPPAGSMNIPDARHDLPRSPRPVGRHARPFHPPAGQRQGQNPLPLPAQRERACPAHRRHARRPDGGGPVSGPCGRAYSFQGFDGLLRALG